MFELTRATVRVGKSVLLHNLNLKFEAGSITTILGANGAGKSSLFRTLLGEYPLRTGEVFFANKPLRQYQQRTLSLMRAYISQQANSMFTLLVIDYLSLARLQHTESESYTQNLILDISQQCDITHLLMREMNELSGGEAQLVEYVRAYLQLYTTGNFDNTCLLLDEPASALDIKQTRVLYQHLQRFCDANGTVIIIDHNINSVCALASHVVLIKNGKVLASGKKSDVFTQKNLDTCFDTVGHMLYSSQDSASSPHALYHLDHDVA